MHNRFRNEINDSYKYMFVAQSQAISEYCPGLLEHAKNHFTPEKLK
jgi:hypothetical protein